MRVSINLYRATRVDICAWCGQYYEKESPVQKYCSRKCRDEARKEQQRIYRRMRNKLKRELPLGTSNLRQSRQKSFKRELELVEKECGRVFDKYKY